MPGFDNNTVYAGNIDFSGNANVTPQVVADGQLLIGSTASPNIKVATLTSIDTTIGITNGSGTIDLKTNSSTKVTTFTSDGTFTKDSRTKFIDLYLVGGGGGGGSGRRALADHSGGGAGGFSGDLCHRFFATSGIPNSLTVIVGLGGAGGVAQTIDDSDGNQGTGGTPTIFGENGFGSGGIQAIGGVGGTGGVDGDAISTGINHYTQDNSLLITTAITSGKGTRTGNGGIGPNYYYCAPGAGGAGAKAVGNYTGGLGGSILQLPSIDYTTDDYIDGGQPSSSAGNPGLDTTGYYKRFTTGSGGGGGAGGNAAEPGWVGGKGGFPGGAGGGGGGSLNTFDSGAGGSGGDGVCIVIEHF